MILYAWYEIILTILFAMLYGFLFYFGKMYTLHKKNNLLGFLFNLLRFLLVMLFFYAIFIFVPSNPILLTILFVSSYLGTIGIIAYKA